MSIAFRASAAALGLALAASPLIASTSSPLDTGRWTQVARISDSDNGVFDGNGDLRSDYTYGTYSSENQTDDFARSFDVFDGMNMLFITGNGAIWAMSDYATLRATIDAKQGTQSTNFRWDSTSSNAAGQDANILSRSGFFEDPWISLAGTHSEGVNSTGIIWGENDWPGASTASHLTLKNNNGGVNVWVSQAAPVPVPASGVLLFAGFGALIALRRKRG